MPTKSSPQITVRLDSVLRAGLDGFAVAKETSAKGELVRRILLDFACGVGSTQDRVGSTLDGIKALVNCEPLKDPLYTVVACQVSPLDLFGT